MDTRILLVRHGGTLLSSEDRFAGSTDVELSDEGRAQAARLGQRLAGAMLAAVYCSDLKRARDTAMAIAAPHGLRAIRSEALREIDHGVWEGRIHGEVEREFAGDYARWSADPFTHAPPGGESGQSVLARALPALRAIVSAHRDETVVVVSHKATNRLLICALLGIDPRRYRERITQDLACLNILRFSSAGDARLVLLNDVSHYTNLPP
jgi:probable phosphoglycerate mutase